MTSIVSYCASSGSFVKDKLKRIAVSQGPFCKLYTRVPGTDKTELCCTFCSCSNHYLKKRVEGKSLIPKILFFLGIRPKSDRRKCTACGECVFFCPVDAIWMPEKRIDPSLCIKMWCLECVRACQESGSSIRGHRVSEALDNSEDRISTGIGP